jgi:hypothetical protein
MALDDVTHVLKNLSIKLSVDPPLPPEKEARVRQLVRQLQDLIDPDSAVTVRTA